jgi:hypothetical protein
MWISSYRTEAPSGAAAPLTGLEWDGNESANTQRVLRWLSPPAAFPMTYVFRVYPKGPKNATDPYKNYWTLFFWGNYGDFGVSASKKLFYGCHPYPFDGPNATTGQQFEISADYVDISAGSGQVAWNRWYTQVIRAYVDGSVYHIDFIFDWDLFISSSGASGVMAYSWATSGWTDPATPSIVVGEAPPNDSNTASWGGYQGREQFKGIIRGIQIYAAKLGATGTGAGDGHGGTAPLPADLATVTAELASPGSAATLWYYNPNPTPSDVTDKSGAGHNPTFPAASAFLWTG